MSLIRQIWVLLLATLLMAFMGSFAVWMASSRGYVETQLRVKNADNAQALALTLSQQKGDQALMELAVAAQFDTGYYQRIVLKDPAGQVIAEHEADPSVSRPRAPQWFMQLVPIESAPGLAQVSDGWRALGSVEVVSHSAYAYDQLWSGTMRTLVWLLGLGVLAGVVATLGVRRIRRPLDATVGQAQALMERRFITVEEPNVPELARLSQAMNAVVERLRFQFDEQAFQVEQLRQEAHCDALTGLSNRTHFMAQLQAALADDEGSGRGSLYMIRVVDLGAVNRVMGHRQTDVLLQKLAAVLKEVSVGVPGVATGRLNGGDFAVCLTSSDVPLPDAEHFADAIKRAFVEMAVDASVVLGTTRWERGTPMAQVLAAADSALARAECRGAFAVERVGLGLSEARVLGEDEWRQRLSDALSQQRIRLTGFPVLGRRSELVHLECPMRMQLEPSGAFESAALWLPMALRCKLTARIDEAAASLALAQIAQDGRPRGVNVAPASLADSGFVPRLRALLTAAPGAASHLWLEVAEVAAVDRFELVRELCKQLRPLGVKIGLEHAGERLARIEFLFEAGLDYIKLDASVVQGVSLDPARAAFVSRTVSMLHSLGLHVYAEGVSDELDLSALMDCGIDGVTGPAVKLPS
ncbi:LapD/MoxY N-terminal periplasmic domain-containing protein [Aquabacterium sp.]|uniref:bifunctional diguanylate cyclase/phosphodiesterase n=1 Tax=Aquabacterium sp. TaxID=1872578 RepID=UPI0035B2D7F0